MDGKLCRVVCHLTWSTKNSSGIVFGGYLSGNVSKSPSANTQLESSLCRLHPAVHSISRDKRWAIRECAARIDFICVVADSASADFPNPPTLQRIADAVAQRRLEDGEALVQVRYLSFFPFLFSFAFKPCITCAARVPPRP